MNNQGPFLKAPVTIPGSGASAPKMLGAVSKTCLRTYRMESEPMEIDVSTTKMSTIGHIKILEMVNINI